MILAYRIFSNLIYPFLIIFIYIRKFFNKEHPLRFKEKILSSNFDIKKNVNTRLIWFHAASIGEFKSILPIIEKININKINIEFLITTTTLSSGNLAATEIKRFKNVQHRFFPLDVSFLIKKFLKQWKPDKIFLVDSEIWPNLIIHARNYKIPLALINARLSKKSYNRWSKFEKTSKNIFSSFDLCLSSNRETKNFLKNLNAKNIHFNGNIKLINKIDIKDIRSINDEILSKSRFWVAASTHDQEEIFCLKVHSDLKKKYNDIITIIAPRHIERSLKIKSLCKKFEFSSQIVKKGELILKNKEIIIINSFGILEEYFKHAKSAFIGKSLSRKLIHDSGQNPISAARMNCKIYHGPYVYNFEEIYEILKKNNISKKIENYEELSNNLIQDLESIEKKDNKFKNTMDSLGEKTLSDTIKNIEKFIFDEI